MGDLAELLDGLHVASKILLAADEEHGEVRAEVGYFGMPLRRRTKEVRNEFIMKEDGKKEQENEKKANEEECDEKRVM